MKDPNTGLDSFVDDAVRDANWRNSGGGLPGIPLCFFFWTILDSLQDWLLFKRRHAAWGFRKSTPKKIQIIKRKVRNSFSELQRGELLAYGITSLGISGLGFGISALLRTKRDFIRPYL